MQWAAAVSATGRVLDTGRWRVTREKGIIYKFSEWTRNPVYLVFAVGSCVNLFFIIVMKYPELGSYKEKKVIWLKI